MRVIFIKDLKGQGLKGDIKEVKDGYAKNYLIKNSYAVPETTTSVDILKKQNEKAAATKQQEEKVANEIKDKLEKDTITFEVKTGKADKLFGSISSKLIHEELTKKKYNIDKKRIVIKEPISTLGTHIIQIELYKNITANLKIVVTSRWDHGR